LFFCRHLCSPWLQAVFGFGALQTGLVFFFFGGVSVFTQAVLLPILGKRLNRLNLTLFGIVFLIVGLVALSIVPNFAVMLVVAAVISLGFGIQIVTLNTLISTNTPENAQGGALGVCLGNCGFSANYCTCFSCDCIFFWRLSGLDGLAFLVSAAISVATIPLVLAFKKIS